MQLAACIIGLGQVGLRFDLEKERAQSPGDIWTHFTAYERLADRFKLVAAVDPNEQAWAPALARNPALKCFKSIAELLGSGLRVDVASICTPDAFHLEHFEALQSRVSGIFLEKPVCLSVELARARTLVAEARARGLALYVNYYKRCEPAVLKALESIASRKETIQHAECRYSGPFMAVGSHALDLLNHVNAIEGVRGALRHPADEGVGYSALLAARGGASASLTYTGKRHELLFELELVTDQSRYVLSENLTRYARSELAPSARYQGYREFKPADASEHATNPNRFVYFLERLHRELSEKKPSYANLEGALETQALLDQIAQSAERR